MSILISNLEPKIEYVGHVFNVCVECESDAFGVIMINGKRCRPDWAKLQGLLGFRPSHNAYANALKRYIISALLTCYVGTDGVYVCDDRFDKITRMINRLYRLRNGTLNVKLDLAKGSLRIWSDGYPFVWGGIIHIRTCPPHSNKLAYFYRRPQSIKTHEMATERFLNYDMDKDILNQ